MASILKEANTKLKTLPLKDLITFKTGKLNSNAAIPNGKYPFFTCSQETYRTNTFSFDCECVLLGGNNANGIYPLKYFNGKFDAYQRTYIIQTKDNATLLNKYLYYALRLKLDLLRSISTGAATKFLTLTILNDIQLEVPSLSIQQKITAILSAYDDLIENNTRRIAILEAMAQALYREWFVHFRYPGHGEVPLVDSPLGPIPQGWEVKQLGDLADVITKGTTPTTLGKHFVEEGVNFLKVESISSCGSIIQSKTAKIDNQTHSLLKRSQLRLNDILFSIAGAIGRVTIVPSEILPANVNQALAIIRLSSSKNIPYGYYYVRSQEFLNFSLGRVVQTAQANVSLSVLSTSPILLPKSATLDCFNSLIEPILQSIGKITTKNENLRQTRDLLLPRLISGQLDVSELEIEPV